jgi:site-specific DNA-cytosine methylase
MKVLSLFDGIAGCRQALKELNIDCEYYASEIDKHAIQVAKANHPDIVHIGDVRDIEIVKDIERLGVHYHYNDTTEFQEYNYLTNIIFSKDDEICEYDNINLLIGGSPCQDIEPFL